VNLLVALLAFIVALGILITVHEFGHYLVARWCNVKVLRFSLGFGRPIYKRTLGPDQTEWVVAAIPLGGYVAMLDENDRRALPIAEADLPRTFNRQPVGKRIAIVLAGPLANFILAIALYTGLNLYGVDEPRAILAPPPTGSLAAQASLGTGGQGGQTAAGLIEVVALDGKPVQSMVDLRWGLLQAGVARTTVRLAWQTPGGERSETRLDFSGVTGADLESDFLRHIGLFPAAPRTVLGNLAADGAAAQAGLRRGDRVLAVDGQPVSGSAQLVNTIRNSGSRILQFEVERDGVPLRVAVTPQAQEEGGQPVGKIGAAVRGEFPMIKVQYGPIESTVRAVDQTWSTLVLTLRMIGRMIAGDVSLKNISGPVTIADYAGQSARIGLATYLTFLAFISISIGLMNLLPIPMLDGGHLLYYLVEILIGRAPPEQVVEWGQRAGMAVLASLMLVALFNDFVRLLL